MHCIPELTSACLTLSDSPPTLPLNQQLRAFYPSPGPNGMYQSDHREQQRGTVAFAGFVSYSLFDRNPGIGKS